MPVPDRAARRRAIGRKIRDRRRALGLSQEAFARIIGGRRGWMHEGPSGAQISNWERGVREPNIKSLTELADALGCDIAALLPSEES